MRAAGRRLRWDCMKGQLPCRRQILSLKNIYKEMKITQLLGLSHGVTVGGNQVLAAGVSRGWHERREEGGLLKGGSFYVYCFSGQGEIPKTIGAEENAYFLPKNPPGTFSHSPDWCDFPEASRQLAEQPFPSWASEVIGTHPPSPPCLRRPTPILVRN